MTDVRFEVNGATVQAQASVGRLSEFLRGSLGLCATKVGCDAGDCGACTVILEGEAVAACMVPVGRLEGASIETLEGLDATGEIDRLQRSFLHHGAAQCGICTPGMLVAACALLRTDPAPTVPRIQDGLGGVLCRCTGYRKIIDAVGAAPAFDEVEAPPPVGKAVGDRLARVDGDVKVRGREVFGADASPDGALLVRVVRSPFHRARFTLGDLDGYVRANPGVEAVFTAADVPGQNAFGVIPGMADQPVFAEHETRFRGEAVAMVVGEPDAVEGLHLGSFPVTWEELAPLMSVEAARDEGATLVHGEREGNVLIRGNVRRGDLDAAFEAADVVVEGIYETSLLEHAYVEPEAGFAERVGDRVEVQVTTQSPHMDRQALEEILGLPAGSVRIRPTAVGGGFGSKLDLSVQPYVAIAAWILHRPARITYTRPESMMSTTKRHPAQMRVRIGASRDGRLAAMDFFGRFDTGAYASWGPTVANRVPVHAGGPYVYDAYRARSEAVHTNGPPSGAFRGFGVPQSTIAGETLLDDLADALGIDALELRFRNALTAGVPTVTGQVFEAGVGYRDCLDALRPHWLRARAGALAANTNAGRVRRGAGMAGMWYGCGNTSIANPSTIKVGLRPEGRIVLFQGAVDMGQGPNTAMTQICADALGIPVNAVVLVGADTDTTPDAGKSSASRQTFVTGNATFLASTRLRDDLLAMAGASEDATIELEEGSMVVRDRGRPHRIELATLLEDRDGLVAVAQATFDPSTTPLDADGQGEPYAMFGYGAQLAEVEVDMELGTVRVTRITAAHDVGRAVNPTLVEGQIEGGVAQGIGMALMEEYVPGRTENLHDYLIPTIGDVPEVVSIMVESNDPVGPYGAKGIGEHTLVPTAPAILNAIRHAVGAAVRHVPATPERVLAAIAEGVEVGGMVEPAADTVQCDACPIKCVIKPGRTGSCDRYGNVDGVLARLDPLLILERTREQDGALVPFAAREDDWEDGIVPADDLFVTGAGSGTTYPDYKPAPFIVSSAVAGVDMITVVTEAIFSYCGVLVKIDTDRHIGAEQQLVRAEGEPIGHVDTAQYGSQMLSLGGVNHLTGGTKPEGLATMRTLLALCEGKEVELTVDEGAELTLQAGRPPTINGVVEERMRVGCGSATIGMFAQQWFGLVDEVVVVDDHITGVLSEHQAGRYLGVEPTGIRVKGRRSTPGRYFNVAEPGTGWGGTNIDDPLAILDAFDPKAARPGLTMLMVGTTGEHHAYFVLDEQLKPVKHELPAELELSVERIRDNCEPAMTSVLFMAGAGGSLRAGATENPVALTRSVRNRFTSVTCGGAPTFLWPGGGITFMVDVTRMPPGAFGYVPTPALVAPIEFTMERKDYEALGGHTDSIVRIEEVVGRPEARPIAELREPVARGLRTRSKRIVMGP